MAGLAKDNMQLWHLLGIAQYQVQYQIRNYFGYNNEFEICIKMSIKKKYHLT